MKTFLWLTVAVVLLGGCATSQPYYGYEQQYPQTQYAPQQVAPVQPAPVYVGCQYPYVPVPWGCVMPSPMVYAPMYPSYGYGRPITEFGIRFGKHGRNFIHGLW